MLLASSAHCVKCKAWSSQDRFAGSHKLFRSCIADRLQSDKGTAVTVFPSVVCVCLQCKHPGHVQLDYQQIRMHTNNTFVLQARNSVLALKGQMLPTSLQLPGEVVLGQCAWQCPTGQARTACQA